MGSMLSIAWVNLTSKGIVGNSARFGNVVNQFYFETGCFVYHLNVLQADPFKLRTLFTI